MSESQPEPHTSSSQAARKSPATGHVPAAPHLLSLPARHGVSAADAGGLRLAYRIARPRPAAAHRAHSHSPITWAGCGLARISRHERPGHGG
ncbi:hypothetical protein DL770_007726 [Monosporascus sp. CRB-9-2]|nr:hypothetical protein DL770_007726 [Monosporascus sp. CRB-9-2]